MNKRLLTPMELDAIHRQRMKELMEQDKSLGFAEAMVEAVESDETKKRELEAQDAKTLKAVGRGSGCPKVICLCGSTRFIGVFQEYYAKLTDEGYIVLTVGRIVPKHEQESERKRKLDELHLRKIDLADEVMILNVGGYIGKSTKAEVEYAASQEKTIIYLEALK